MRNAPARATILFGTLVMTTLAVAAADAVRTLDDLPPGAGRDVLVRSCLSCHELGVVIARGRTRPEWAEVTGLMIDRGAVIRDDDLKVLLDYLTAVAPPH
jgi:competence protein ComEA